MLNRFKRSLIVLRRFNAILLIVGYSGIGRAEVPLKIELKSGDRIVLLGNALIERDQNHGYFETTLVSRFPDRDLSIRNLGWSGDTVFGHARGGFGTTTDGFNKLKQHIDSIKPTVVFVAYGGVESFDGQAGLPHFVNGLNILLDVLAKHTDRIVMIGPNRQEDLGRPLPDPKTHNADLARYRDAVREVASKRGYTFIDLYEKLGTDPREHLTDNGIHMTELGGWRLAQVLTAGIGLDSRVWNVKIGVDSQPETIGAKLDELKINSEGAKFRLLDATLPSPNPPKSKRSPVKAVGSEKERSLTIQGLKKGRYALMIDGKKILVATSADWDRGVSLTEGPEFDQLDRLRQTVHEKNLLYFYRWRPQNETYLFGFRNYEQGQNAREVPMFDPLVVEQEKAIATLRVPKPHVYELIREGEAVR